MLIFETAGHFCYNGRGAPCPLTFGILLSFQDAAAVADRAIDSKVLLMSLH